MSCDNCHPTHECEVCLTDAAGVKTTLKRLSKSDAFGSDPVKLYLDANGDPVPAADIAAAADLTLGACDKIAPQSQWIDLCEEIDNGDGTFTDKPFCRLVVISFDDAGAPIQPFFIQDFEQDKATPYTVVDPTKVGECSDCDPLINGGDVVDSFADFV